MKIALACLALAALPLSGYSQPVKETKKPDAPVAAKPTNPLYQLDRTETFELASPETGKTYKIAVAFPEDYAKAPVGKTYPVIYVIDAQWQFPLIYAITGALMWEKVMPPSLLVGISWKTTNGNLQDLRHQDLIPSGSGCFPTSSRTIQPINTERSPAAPPVRCLSFIRCCPGPTCLRAISARVPPSMT
jgi:hypothetical protein